MAFGKNYTHFNKYLISYSKKFKISWFLLKAIQTVRVSLIILQKTDRNMEVNKPHWA